jgi:ABC-type multidrug transport system ATPase subunit
LCHRIAIINKGKLIALDTPPELKANVRNILEVGFDHPDGIIEELKKLNFAKCCFKMEQI